MAALVADVSTQGWGATVVAEGDPRGIKPFATADALNAVVTLVQPDQVLEAEYIDYEAGIVTLTGGGAGYVFAQYTSGYATVPAALVQITNEIAAMFYRSAGVNAALQSEKIGNYQYTQVAGNALAQFQPRLDAYRKVSL